MKFRALTIAVLAAAALAIFPVTAFAQFKNNAFSQSYNDDKAKSGQDSVDVLFSFPEFFGGLSHKREARIGTMFAGSTILVGAQQIYNKDYWKLPIVYGTVAGGLGAGIYFNTHEKQDIAKWCFIGAGVAYWGTLLDGALSYKPSPYPYPGKATICSILCPGLGQIYNHEYWKVPIYVGGMICAYYFYNTNQVNFERFRRIYIEATAESEEPYTGPISAETALYYRNIYRTYRDYSILALGLVYLIQIIDANVFAYMHDFEVADDLAFKVEPMVTMPAFQIAAAEPQKPAVGATLRFSF